MFTGIIEALGEVVSVTPRQKNRELCVRSSISGNLTPGQSVSHDGVCLTVTHHDEEQHWVTVVDETLSKSTLFQVAAGALINLERSMRADGRFDGHLVQGHTDQMAVCQSIDEQGGSHVLHFSYTHDPTQGHIAVEKGSIAVNGISLTCFGVTDGSFSVAIVPHTFAHTNLSHLQVGMLVNIEFDILGKYIQRLIAPRT